MKFLWYVKKNVKMLIFDLFEKINVFYLWELVNFLIVFVILWYLIEYYVNYLRCWELMFI